MHVAKRSTTTLIRSYSIVPKLPKASLWKKFLPFIPIIGLSGGWLFWQNRLVKARRKEVIQSADQTRKARKSQYDAIQHHISLTSKWSKDQ